MNKNGASTFLSLATIACLVLIMAGCARKHVMSSPAGATPGQRAVQKAPAGATPAKTEVKPEPAPQKMEVIEETYVVDAPVQDSPQAEIVLESDLDEEPLPLDPAAKQEEQVIQPTTEVTPKPTAATTEEAMPTPATTAEPVIAADKYYVQIGAFSDEANANRALARLKEAGYEGSKVSQTGSGLFRVQAGTFPDRTTAEKALNALKNEYPKGFVLKTD